MGYDAACKSRIGCHEEESMGHAGRRHECVLPALLRTDMQGNISFDRRPIANTYIYITRWLPGFARVPCNASSPCHGICTQSQGRFVNGWFVNILPPLKFPSLPCSHAPSLSRSIPPPLTFFLYTFLYFLFFICIL